MNKFSKRTNLIILCWALMDTSWAFDFSVVALIFGCIALCIHSVQLFKIPNGDNLLIMIWLAANTIWCIDDVIGIHLVIKIIIFTLLIISIIILITKGDEITIRNVKSDGNVSR